MPPAPQPPCSTYRLQFNQAFRFADARNLVPYLHDLGVTDVYASPYLMAQPGSMHGYDICDHTRLNPELGEEADHEAFVGALGERGMGQILDFVANHMGIDPATNPWWRDVLENGQSSAYAHFFDIDWDPIKTELKGKVLLPILGDQYGLVLERGELRLAFADGALRLDYFETRLPINPRGAVMVFERGIAALRQELGDEDPTLREFLSILTALRNMPGMDETDPARIAERRREKEVARERLIALVDRAPRIREHIEQAVADFNGTAGRGESFDALHTLLEQQAYRLSYWRTASHEINYRRFFDVNALAGLRMEDPEVFEATHVLIARLLATGAVSGLRIDHPDGLYDPGQYFGRLQSLWRRVRSAGGEDESAGPPLYVLAEKILSPGEELPAEWPIAGTTGYQFANDVGGVLIDPAGQRPLRQFYARYAHALLPFSETVYESKRLITRSSLASELNVLAHALNRISESHRRSRDFTLDSLRALLQEVVACFPVYRTYISPAGWTPADRERIETAVTRARWRNPSMEGSIFDFFREVVLPRGHDSRRDPEASDEEGGGADRHDDRRDGYPPGDDAEYRARLAFAMKLQQYTAPVQAKGVEDTAFYRDNLLVALGEVGGSPAVFGRSVAEFHEANQARQLRRPLEMTTTETHDTKLGEDVRARIAALSQVPREWRQHVSRWTRVNRAHRTIVQGEPAPDRNDEYRFYQVLVGMWPPGQAAPDTTLVSRLSEYMAKAVKEAKVHTSWITDNPAYDLAVARFVERALTSTRARPFLASFLPFAARVAELGLGNSLAQLVLKLASPGIPDFYQGSELWDFRLVDPDNRGRVDFGMRRALLDQVGPQLPDLASAAGTTDRTETVHDLLEHWQDGRIKFWITAAGLRARRARRALFQRGDYLALEVSIRTPSDAIAFARQTADQAAIALVPRLLGKIGNNWSEWARGWGPAELTLPPALAGRTWRNVLTGVDLRGTPGSGGGETLPVAQALGPCPVALLVAI